MDEDHNLGKGRTGSMKELVGADEWTDTTADCLCVDDINASNGAGVGDDASADHFAVAQLGIEVVLAFAWWLCNTQNPCASGCQGPGWQVKIRACAILSIWNYQIRFGCLLPF